MSMARDLATARLYGLLPSHIRAVDAANGAPLKAFLRALAAGTVALDAEVSRLLSNMFVETADAEGLDNLGRLVGAEPLAPLPPEAQFSPRAFIANTVRHRRRKGTPEALEDLAGDLGGTGAVVVEYYQRLVRLAALVDPRTDRPGTASVVDGDCGAQVGGAFDRAARLADVRSIARAGGRHGVPNVGVHLIRFVAPVFGAVESAAPSAAMLAGIPAMMPWSSGGGGAPAGYFQLSPFAGERAPLLHPQRRDTLGGARMDDGHRVDRLRRLPLARETEALRRAIARGDPRPAGALFDGSGGPFTLYVRRQGASNFAAVAPEQLLIANLEAVPPGAPRPAASCSYRWQVGGATGPATKTAEMPIVAALDPVTGRAVFAAPAKPADEVVEARLAYCYGAGDAIGAGAHDRAAPDVPAEVSTGDFLRIVDAWSIDAHAVPTLAQALVDWTAETNAARGFIVCARCDHEGGAPMTITLRPGTELHIVAGRWAPPRTQIGAPPVATRQGYIVRAARRFAITAPIAIAAAGAPPAGGAAGALVLDGLALAGGIAIGANAASRLWMRHVTARTAAGPAMTVSAASSGLALTIERSVTGPLALAKGRGTLVVRRSIVGVDPGAAAIDAAGFEATIDDATLLGTTTLRGLDATGAIFVGAVTVTERQAGCVRYSAVAPGSATPHRFRCQPDLATGARARALGVKDLDPDQAALVAQAVAPVFLDIDPGEPSHALLSSRCAAELRTGGEGGKEMGAFAATGEPMRLANITALFADYLPTALEGAIIDDTRNRASARRRNVP